MNIPKATIFTALAGLGAGALTTYLAHHQETSGRSRSNGFDLHNLLDTATKAGSTYLGGNVMGKTMGLGNSMGEKLTAAYLAGKAAKASAGETAGHAYEETSHRASDAWRALRGRPSREEEEAEHGMSSALVALGVVGFGAALAAVLHQTGALDSEKVRKATSDVSTKAKKWAGMESVDDDTLTERIRQKIEKRSGVSFVVNEGNVTVRGDVPDYQREEVLDDIRGVAGVKDVEDRLSRG